MGGYGSTRWQWHIRQCTVNECYSFDLAHVPMSKIMADEQVKSTVWNWKRGTKDAGNMAIDFYPASLQLVFKYHASNDNTSRNVTQTVRLETMPLHYGGVRYWLQCPACSKRVRTVHCPNSKAMDAIPFRCRECWNLSYSSSQESKHKSGHIWELFDVAEKIDTLHAKLRKTRGNSKNRQRYNQKLQKLYGLHDELVDMSELKSAQLHLKIGKLMATMK